nr:anaerobic ribonucleoside-triphosphate reductase [Anoxybacter fermentans]
MKKKRQRCEVYSRVVGYLSPISHWNIGKKSEFKDRKTYNFPMKDVKEEKTETCC